MNNYTMKLTQNEAYFLTQIIGNISSSQYARIIFNESNICDSAIKDKLYNLVMNNGGEILDNLYAKLKSFDVDDITEPVTKYKVLYKFAFGEYNVTTGYYKSIGDFNSANNNSAYASIILDSAKEFIE